MKKSLDRFLIAQQNYYYDAYTELKAGKKRSHWMWFIFPQIRGLGYSDMAKYYAIESREEAENYITDPTIGHNLIEISTVLLEIKDNEAAKQRLRANAQNPNAAENNARIFTREQIGKMSGAEFAKNERAIMEQLRKGLIR